MSVTTPGKQTTEVSRSKTGWQAADRDENRFDASNGPRADSQNSSHATGEMNGPPRSINGTHRIRYRLALLSSRASAQSCTAPCFAQTPAELALGVVPTNLTVASHLTTGEVYRSATERSLMGPRIRLEMTRLLSIPHSMLPFKPAARSSCPAAPHDQQHAVLWEQSYCAECAVRSSYRDTRFIFRHCTEGQSRFRRNFVFRY